MAFTFFFRDYDVITAAVNLLVQNTMGRSRVRIWDAGCAMGPEPYTLLIALAESMGRFSFENLRIDATDHDESGSFGEIIEKGQYSAELVSRIPGDFLEKYFSPVDTTRRVYEIIPKLRNKVVFKRHDLLSLIRPGDGYAMIMCKNVLLHFSESQRIEVLSMFHDALSPDGLLVMEHTQKMPADLLDSFSQTSDKAQIYSKKTPVHVVV